MIKLRRFFFLRPAEIGDLRTNDDQVVYEEQVRLSMNNAQANIRKLNVLGKQVADLTEAVLELQSMLTAETKTSKVPKTPAQD